MAVDFGDRRVMACTVTELTRWLCELTGDPEIALRGGAVEIPLPGGALQVRAAELAPRRIALLAIAQLEVSFQYPAAISDAARGWIRAFDRHTQRGGG